MRILLPPSRGVDATATPGAPPLTRYNGVLFRALDTPGWGPAAWRWARETLIVHELDGGLVSEGAAPGDERLEIEVLLDDPLVLDLRSKEYQRRIPAPEGVWMLRVVSEDDSGRRLAVSHWNKHHKGVLVGAMARDRPRSRSIRGLLSWAERSGIRLERTAGRELDLVV